jgi:hypothetical protein
VHCLTQILTNHSFDRQPPLALRCSHGTAPGVSQAASFKTKFNRQRNLALLLLELFPGSQLSKLFD